MMIRNLQFKVFDVKNKCWMVFPQNVSLVCTGNGEILTVRHGVELIYVQATGLLDINHTKIFEGDIAEFQVQNEFGSWQKKIGVMEMNPAGFWAFRFEAQLDILITAPPLIIGHRLTHPELLKLIS